MSISFFTPIYSGPNATIHERCPFLRCTTHFFDFGQKAYTIYHSNSFKIDVVEREDIQPSWMMTTVRIIALATLIVPILMAIGSWIYKAVNSFQVIKLENHLHKLPDELLVDIFKKVDTPSCLLLTSTSQKNKEVIEKDPYLKGHRIILEALEKSYKEIKDIEDPDKSSAFKKLVKALSLIDAEKAEAIADTIEDSPLCNKSKALAAVAKAHIVSDPKKAEEILERAYASLRWKVGQVRHHADYAKDKIARNFAALPDKADRAFAIANSILFSMKKLEALAFVSSNFAKQNLEQVLEAAEEAYTEAKNLPTPLEGVEAFTKIARSIGTLDPQKVMEIVMEAFNTLEAVEGVYRTSALSNIADVLPALNPEDANILAENFIAHALTLEASRDKFRMLSAFAKHLAPSNLPRAREVVLQAIREINTPENNQYMVGIAEGLTILDPKQSERTIEECIGIAKNLAYYNKTDSLANIAKALIHTNPQKALELSRIAFAEAQTIEVNMEKLASLPDIIEAFGMLNLKRCGETGDLALEEAKNLENEITKSVILEMIAKALAKFHPEKAVEAANIMKNPFEKLRVLSKIALILG